jgi:hypothetical protein
MSAMNCRLNFLLPLFFALASLSNPGGANAAEAPVKAIFSEHIGWEVNPLTKENVCTVECRSAVASGEPGGFEYPESVAAAPNGDVYVTEIGGARLQKLTATGKFIAMFGKEVNETTKSSVCTAEEIAKANVKCQRGTPAAEAIAFAQPQGVAVEPGNEEDIYVEDSGIWAIDKYTPSGAFVWRIGKRVNETKDATSGASEAEQNICTAVSHDTCGAGTQGEPEKPEPTAFDFDFEATGVGNEMTVGPGPEHLLYVADHNGVQEFDAAGGWKDRIELPSSITASEPGGITGIAIDRSSGILYVVYNHESTIHEFDATTKAELASTIQVPDTSLVLAIAADSAGHVVVADRNSESEVIIDAYRASDGALVSTSVAPPSAGNAMGLGFSEQKTLYAAFNNAHEVLSYNILPVGEFKTGAGVCSAGPEQQSSATFECSLTGEANPFNVSGTQAAFEWGKTCAFGFTTATQSLATVEEPLSVNATVGNVRPNDTLCFRLTGHDQNVKPPEALTGEAVSVTTPPVQPRILGTNAAFVTSSSVVLSAELNPENAPTEYYFELAAEPKAEVKLSNCHNAKSNNCPGVVTTSSIESGVYGAVGATLEAKDLQASTGYRYRLNAVNTQETKIELRAVSQEGTFTTLGIPLPEAFTGGASAVGQTSALIEGAVNPNGAQSTYVFELGVYEGSATQFDIVTSSSTGTGTAPEPERIAVTGLQPGVTYAYRIAAHSGFGSAQGALATFTTAPLPVALMAPVTPMQLAPPPITFPKPAIRCKHGYRLNRRKCVKKKKTSKHKRRKQKKK